MKAKSFIDTIKAYISAEPEAELVFEADVEDEAVCPSCLREHEVSMLGEDFNRIITSLKKDEHGNVSINVYLSKSDE